MCSQFEGLFAVVGSVREGSFAAVSGLDRHFVGSRYQVERSRHLGGRFVFPDQPFGRTLGTVALHLIDAERTQGKRIIRVGFGAGDHFFVDRKVQLQITSGFAREVVYAFGFRAGGQHNSHTRQPYDRMDIFFHCFH